MNDLVVKTKVMPSIQFNYDDIKEHVKSQVDKYKDIVVTLETLKGCKDTSKELAGLRVKLDKFRKEVKKEVKKPIDLFETKIKELVNLIEDVEDPIKSGIKRFDDESKEETKRLITNLFLKEAAELDQKYKDMFEVDPKLLNVATTQKAIKEFISWRVDFLKRSQDKEKADLEMITLMVETENKTLLTNLEASEFTAKLTPENVLDIVRNMQAIAERQRTAEEAAKQAAEAPKVKEVEPQPTPEPAPQVEKVEEPTISVNIRLTGTRTQLNGLKTYMAGQDIKWSNL